MRQLRLREFGELGQTGIEYSWEVGEMDGVQIQVGVPLLAKCLCPHSQLPAGPCWAWLWDKYPPYPICPGRAGTEGLLSSKEGVFVGPGQVLPVLSQVPPGTLPSPPPHPVLHKYLRNSCLNARAPRCLPGYLSWPCVCRPGSHHQPCGGGGFSAQFPTPLRQAFTPTHSPLNAFPWHPPTPACGNPTWAPGTPPSGTRGIIAETFRALCAKHCSNWFTSLA